MEGADLGEGDEEMMYCFSIPELIGLFAAAVAVSFVLTYTVVAWSLWETGEETTKCSKS